MSASTYEPEIPGDHGEELETIGPARIREEWCSLLKSGRYKQVQGALRVTGEDGDSYDALGLLCKVVVDLGVDYMTPQEWFRESPPVRICEHALLSCEHDDGGEASGGDMLTVQNLNDYGVPFDAIAEIVEKGDFLQEIKSLARDFS